MTAHYLPAADVDLECLTALEERMFERSNRAGASGNWQWGLDVGEHQDRWNPYNGLPTHWNFDDRDQHESELEPGCDFSCGSDGEQGAKEAAAAADPSLTKNRPRPRPAYKLKQ